MSEKAYQHFLELPIGTIFTSTAEWGYTEEYGPMDAFIKINDEQYRRTYDYIRWNAAERHQGVGIRGGEPDYGKTLEETKDSWPDIVTMEKVPEWISHNPPLTDEECLEHEMRDHERLRKYVEETGELPEMGFW